MKYLLSLLACVCFVSSVCAQQKDTTYYNKHWRQTDKAHAMYFCPPPRENAGLYTVKYYYMDGHPQMSGIYESLNPEIRNGYFIYYYPTHTKSDEGYYKNDKKEGMWKHYFLSGILASEVPYKNGLKNGYTVYYDSTWGYRSEIGYYNNDERDTMWTKFYPQIRNPKYYAVYQDKKIKKLYTYYPSGPLKRKEVYGKLFTSKHCYDSLGHTVPYFPYTQLPVFAENIDSFIKANTRYPKDVREKNINGEVKVGFVVEPDSTIDYIRIVQPLDDDCDDEALRIIENVKVTRPALIDGVPDKYYMEATVPFYNKQQ